MDGHTELLSSPAFGQVDQSRAPRDTEMDRAEPPLFFVSDNLCRRARGTPSKARLKVDNGTTGYETAWMFFDVRDKASVEKVITLSYT